MSKLTFKGGYELLSAVLSWWHALILLLSKLMADVLLGAIRAIYSNAHCGSAALLGC
jgi:hypothetical protein